MADNTTDGKCPACGQDEILIPNDGLDDALNAIMRVDDERELLSIAREAMGLPGGWVGSLAVGYDQLMAAVANKWAGDSMRNLTETMEGVKLRSVR